MRSFSRAKSSLVQKKTRNQKRKKELKFNQITNTQNMLALSSVHHLNLTTVQFWWVYFDSELNNLNVECLFFRIN